MVICRSSAAVGPGADSPSSCTAVSSVRLPARRSTLITTALGCTRAGVTSADPRSRTPAGHRRAPARPTRRSGAARGCADQPSHTAAGHRVQALVQRVGVGGEQQRLDARRAAAIGGVVDIDMAAAGVVLGCAAARRGHSGPPSSRSAVSVLATDSGPHPPMRAASALSTLARAPRSRISRVRAITAATTRYEIAPAANTSADPRQVPQLQGDASVDARPPPATRSGRRPPTPPPHPSCRCTTAPARRTRRRPAAARARRRWRPAAAHTRRSPPAPTPPPQPAARLPVAASTS